MCTLVQYNSSKYNSNFFRTSHKNHSSDKLSFAGRQNDAYQNSIKRRFMDHSLPNKPNIYKCAYQPAKKRSKANRYATGHCMQPDNRADTNAMQPRFQIKATTICSHLTHKKDSVVYKLRKLTDCPAAVKGPFLHVTRACRRRLHVRARETAAAACTLGKNNVNPPQCAQMIQRPRNGARKVTHDCLHESKLRSTVVDS